MLRTKSRGPLGLRRNAGVALSLVALLAGVIGAASATAAPPAAGRTSVDDTSSNFVYAGPWQTTAAAGKFDGSDHWVDTPGSSFTFTFTGTQAAFYSATERHHGLETISVDGGAPVTVSLYSAVRVDNTLVWTSAVLTEGVHHVIVTESAQIPAGSSGQTIAIDRAEIVGAGVPTSGPTGGTTAVDDTSAAFAYAGPWQTTAAAGKFDGSDHWVDRPGSSFTFTFTGTQTAFYSATASHHGLETISVDGGASVDVSLYSASRVDNTLVWTSAVLTNGMHHVTVTESAQIPAGSSGRTIAIDRAEVVGAGVTPGGGTTTSTPPTSIAPTSTPPTTQTPPTPTTSPAPAPVPPVPPVAPSGGIVFGTLVTQASTAAAESAGGAKEAMLELNWSAYEPAKGQFSASYIAQQKAKLASFQAAGQSVTLALGVHNPPGWVRSLPDAIAVDEHGAQAPRIDMVFSQPVRDAVSAYFAEINKDLGLHNFNYVRLTSGGNGEMLFNANGGSYTAFSSAAQNGPNMATGVPRNPFPGWKPGDRSITTAQVKQWADWYVGALDNVTTWQMSQLGQLGFTGTYQALTPGSGMRPNGYADAINNYLPDGLVGVGAVWQTYYANLAGQKNVMAYVSSVADGSGADDSCSATDAKAAVTAPAENSWSATRWVSLLADTYGFSKGGENPGFGDGPAVEPHYGDTSGSGLMAVSLRQASTCGFQAFYWAHDDQLYNGHATFAEYARQIRSLG